MKDTTDDLAAELKCRLDETAQQPLQNVGLGAAVS
jgi:hypothetical protein